MQRYDHLIAKAQRTIAISRSIQAAARAVIESSQARINRSEEMLATNPRMNEPGRPGTPLTHG
jgi:hypothetical protein